MIEEPSAEIDRNVNADLLQAFEHTLEEVRRLSELARILLEKMEAGERLTDVALADYQQQLRTVNEQRERVKQMVDTLWQQIGNERAH